MKDCVVIIPAFNEEDSLGLVLNELPKERLQSIIVINNGSTDKTREVAEKFQAQVFDEPRRGYGQACLTGIQKALELNPQYIAFIDADYSDYPQELTDLIEQLDRGHDLVIGTRTRGKAQAKSLLPQAIFGNWLATSLLWILFKKVKFSDLGPFRAIRTSSLQKLNMQDKTFGWTVEMQAKALIHDLKCTEVSVSYRQRIGVSKITGTVQGTLKAGYKIITTIFYLWITQRKLRTSWQHRLRKNS